jgi:hypothetical protein
MIWVRVVVFTLFVTAQLTIVRGPREDPTDLLVLLGAVYALSFCWLGLRHLNRSYLNQAYAQIAVDLVLITWTVNRTGTIDSYFGLLYFVAIVMSSILLRRKSSYATAIAASLLYGVHLDLAYFGVLPSTGSESFPPLINLQIIVGVTIFGFCAVGFLVNTLVETLHVSDVALEESTEQVAFLQALTTCPGGSSSSIRPRRESSERTRTVSWGGRSTRPSRAWDRTSRSGTSSSRRPTGTVTRSASVSRSRRSRPGPEGRRGTSGHSTT